MKALVNPKLKDLADAALDIHGVEGVQIECNATTLWVNVNGICILRIGGVETLEIAGTEYEMRMPILRPVEEDLGTPDEEEEGDEEEEQPERAPSPFHRWKISNGKNGVFAEYTTETTALQYIPQPHAKHLGPFYIEHHYPPGCKGVNTKKYKWNFSTKKWHKLRTPERIR